MIPPQPFSWSKTVAGVELHVEDQLYAACQRHGVLEEIAEKFVAAERERLRRMRGVELADGSHLYMAEGHYPGDIGFDL